MIDVLGLNSIPAALRLARASRLRRFPLTNEKETQREVHSFLLWACGCVMREHRLSGDDIPDFFLPEFGLAIEVKLKNCNSKMRVFRQLERYARHEQVRSLLLMTNLAMTLPADINGKPAFVCSLGEGWL